MSKTKLKEAMAWWTKELTWEQRVSLRTIFGSSDMVLTIEQIEKLYSAKKKIEGVENV